VNAQWRGSALVEVFVANPQEPDPVYQLNFSFEVMEDEAGTSGHTKNIGQVRFD